MTNTTDLKDPKSVTKQELRDPVDWGEFVGSDRVNLLTPPLEILKAAFTDPIKPTEVAYVVVVGAQQKEKKQNRPKRNVLNKNVKDVAGGMNQDKSDLRVRLENAETNKDVLVATGKNFNRKRLFGPTKCEVPKYKLVIEEGDEEHSVRSALENSTPQYNLVVESSEKDDILESGSVSSMDSLSYSDDGEDVSTVRPNSLIPTSNSDQSKEPEVELMELLKNKVHDSEMASTLLNKLAESERRERKLQLQLQHSGVTAVTEDIPFNECKTKINEIAARMNEIGGNDTADSTLREEYFKLEQEMEKYNAAMMLTEEWDECQAEAEKKWEEDNAKDNLEALKRVRRHMPVEVRRMTIEELQRPQNDKILPDSLIKRFKRTNVITLIRMDPEDIERMHPSTLESMRVTGLTLTERRALYIHLAGTGAKWKKMQKTDPEMTGRKYKWFTMMKNNFKENLDKYQYHIAKYGPPCNHPHASESCSSGCPLIGRSCPVVADGQVDYTGDYGHPDTDDYETSNLLSRSQKQEDDDGVGTQVNESTKFERNQARTIFLKEHYKGKLLEVSKASGSCESMDDMMEKIESNLRHWVELEASPVGSQNLASKFTEALYELKLAVLGFAQRAGVQIRGAKQKGSKTNDPRSLVEAALADELCEYAFELCQYIDSTMRAAGMGSNKDNRIFSTISALKSVLKELHERNVDTTRRLQADVQQLPRSHARFSVESLREVTITSS